MAHVQVPDVPASVTSRVHCCSSPACSPPAQLARHVPAQILRCCRVVRLWSQAWKLPEGAGNWPKLDAIVMTAERSSPVLLMAPEVLSGNWLRISREQGKLLHSSTRIPNLTSNAATLPCFPKHLLSTMSRRHLVWKCSVLPHTSTHAHPQTLRKCGYKVMLLALQLALIKRAPTKVAGIMMIYFGVNSLPGRKISLCT